MNYTRYAPAFLLLLPLVLALGCARTAAPEGGPKDVTPPKVLKTKPPLGATNVKPEKIRIYFDEYTQVKDAAKEFYVSPPLKTPLLPVMKGHSIEFTISDSLRDSTTYVLNFGKGLVDLTEGNVLKGFSYVFSTGDSIDHGTLSGLVRDAFTQDPLPDVFAMLYLPKGVTPARDTVPDAIAKTDEKGYFKFRNVPMQPMNIVALNDKNTNFRYDQPTEGIAFQVELAQPSRMTAQDTLTSKGGDSVSTSPTSPKQDSLALHPKSDTPRAAVPEVDLILDMFSRADRAQMLIVKTRPLPEQLHFVFSRPPEGSIEYSPMEPQGFGFVRQPSAQGDTVDLWLTDSAAAHRDTLVLHVSYLKTDSLKQLVPTVDTVRLGFEFEDEKEDKTKDQDAVQDTVTKQKKLPPLSIQLKAQNVSALRPHDTLWFEADRRIDYFDTAKLQMLRLVDSVEVSFALVRDTLRPNALGLAYPWPVDTAFSLKLRQGTFRSLLGLESDSMEYRLQGLHPSDFSAIHLRLFDAPTPCLLQLFTDKKTKATLYQATYLGGDSAVTLRYLQPGVYGLRIIHDSNSDGQWTTGNYDKGLQPETVRYFKDPQGEADIKVRRNWEYDIDVHYNELPK